MRALTAPPPTAAVAAPATTAQRTTRPLTPSRPPPARRPTQAPTPSAVVAAALGGDAAGGGSPAAPPPTKASTLLAQGRAKYAAGDRMGGLRLFEAALDASPTPEEAAAAFFNATAVHGGFGDVELAQVTARGFLATGVLEWEEAVAAAAGAPDGGPLNLVPPKWSPQVAIQLRKFAAGVRKAAAAAAAGGSGAVRGGRPISKPSPGGGAGGGGGGGGSGQPASKPSGDISDRLQTDLAGLDGSAAGVARRVAGLLAALVGLGAVLFLAGLGYMEGPPPGFGGR